MKAMITDGLKALNSPVPEDTANQLVRYADMLIEKNQHMNLTAITDPAEIVQLHFLDCAALLGCMELTNKSLIDVGTGAGFPGMVLKILVPDLKLTLLDGLQKRLDWLKEVCEALSLDGVTFLHGRAEDDAHTSELRESFDYATARAVANLNLLSELCLPFVKIGGKFVAMKTRDTDDEISASIPAISQLGGHLLPYYEYSIPYTAIERRAVRVEKLQHTPAAYPRRWAKMQKKPL